MAISIINSKSLDVTGQDGTGAAQVPSGTTAQRPSSPANGYIRYNTTISDFEVYNGAWVALNYTAAPVNTVAPAVTGTPYVDVTLSCTTGTWSNSPTSYSYQWLANNVAITSATSNTFTLTSTQLGANITCNVLATNIAGSVNAASNSVGPVQALTLQYVVVAGGGAGGSTYGGGGGAGGLLANSVSVVKGTQYTVTVGGGGAINGGNGANSSISGTGLTTILAYGGGGGGEPYNVGKNGGSGGGGGQQGAPAGGLGTAGQGNNGGPGADGPAGGVGGGAGTAGSIGSGGNGAVNTIAGSTSGQLYNGSYYLAGGGSGNQEYSGGIGGGGAGGTRDTMGRGGLPGSTNTGGGGGCGGAGNSDHTPGAGGSGVVILSMPTATFSNTYTGSNVVVITSGSNTIMQFNSSGTYTA